jgi:hypothetical protein
VSRSQRRRAFVEVTADSLYEAVAQGRVLSGMLWAEEIGHGQTTITVTVKQPEVAHTVRMRDCSNQAAGPQRK